MAACLFLLGQERAVPLAVLDVWLVKFVAAQKFGIKENDLEAESKCQHGSACKQVGSNGKQYDPNTRRLRHWPVFRQQKTVFAPDDALLATIEALGKTRLSHVLTGFNHENKIKQTNKRITTG